jgi:hypothetical protein
VSALTGRRLWTIGLAGAAVLAVLFVLDYAGGRSVYAALATYHAYLEFPVLLALLPAPASRGSWTSTAAPAVADVQDRGTGVSRRVGSGGPA